MWIYRFLLLALSWAFFLIKDPAAIIWLVSITLLGYGVGLVLSDHLRAGETPGMKAQSQMNCKRALGLSVGAIVAILVFFKYGNLFLGGGIFIPLGLSYYSLMVIGYLIDVYRGDVEAEKNILIFALYVSFFPQITAGPIGRGKELLAIYREKIRISPEDIKAGLFMITLGVYEKFVMADNLSKVVDSIVSSDARGMSLVVAFFMFSFVIYYDFAGYSRIAIGLGRLMGVRLADNFHAPYFSTSIKEFWRRWHISLSSWFRDYLYIPMGGNKKGRIRRDLNTLLVFTVSGAWHGSALGYWLWGLIHGLFLVIENGFRSVFGKRKRAFGTMRVPLDMLKRTAVFILVSFAWVPFYSGGIDKTFSMFGRMFSGDDTFFERLYDGFGLSKKIWLVLVISFVLYLVIALLDEHFKYKLHEKIAGHGVIIFILAVVLYTVLILVGDYGSEYDAATFIYGGF